MRTLWGILGAVGGVIAVLMQTPPDQAISSLASWAKWVGVDSLPGWLASQKADWTVTLISAALFLTSLWLFLKSKKSKSINEEGYRNRKELRAAHQGYVEELERRQGPVDRKNNHDSGYDVWAMDAINYIAFGKWEPVSADIDGSKRLKAWIAASRELAQKASDGAISIYGTPGRAAGFQKVPLASISLSYWWLYGFNVRSFSSDRPQFLETEPLTQGFNVEIQSNLKTSKARVEELWPQFIPLSEVARHVYSKHKNPDDEYDLAFVNFIEGFDDTTGGTEALNYIAQGIASHVDIFGIHNSGKDQIRINIRELKFKDATDFFGDNGSSIYRKTYNTTPVQLLWKNINIRKEDVEKAVTSIVNYTV